MKQTANSQIEVGALYGYHKLKLKIMSNLNTRVETKVLIPTDHFKYPFLIKTLSDKGIDEYWLVRSDGTLSGDAFSAEEKNKYPQYLANI